MDANTGQGVRQEVPGGGWAWMGAGGCKRGHTPHDPANPFSCRCTKRLYHLGQDEAIFKLFALPAFYWTVHGKGQLRPKTEGPGCMLSSFFCSRRGFGFPMTPDELVSVNAYRAVQGREPLLSSPGNINFKYGKNADGYWDAAKFAVQCVNMLDCLLVLYPNEQILQEVDHSSGHMAAKVDALLTDHMNKSSGGKQCSLHDAIIGGGVADWNGDPLLGDVVPTIFNTNTGVGYQLTIGAVQTMNFSNEDGTPPPQFEPDAQLRDRPMTDPDKQASETARRIKENVRLRVKWLKEKAASPHLDIAEPQPVSLDPTTYIIPGYGGRPKGYRQVLWERGEKRNLYMSKILCHLHSGILFC